MEQEPKPEKPDALPKAPQAPAPLGPSPDVREVLYRALALGFLIVIGVIVLIIAAVSIGSGLLAGLAGSSVPAPAVVPAITTAVPATLSLPPTTAPVEILPENLEVSVSVEPKSIGGMVTVNFAGGKGRAQAKEIEARLTRQDGTLVTGTMDPQLEFPQIILQGSKGTDQLEVFVRMYSGKVYKILDQKVLYPARY